MGAEVGPRGSDDSLCIMPMAHDHTGQSTSLRQAGWIHMPQAGSRDSLFLLEAAENVKRLNGLLQVTEARYG